MSWVEWIYGSWERILYRGDMFLTLNFVKGGYCHHGITHGANVAYNIKEVLSGLTLYNSCCSFSLLFLSFNRTNSPFLLLPNSLPLFYFLYYLLSFLFFLPPSLPYFYSFKDISFTNNCNLSRVMRLTRLYKPAWFKGFYYIWRALTSFHGSVYAMISILKKNQETQDPSSI